MAVYSVISLILLAILFTAFWNAEHSGAFFTTSVAIRAVSAALMLVSFWFFTAAVLRASPILLTAETALQDPRAITGIVRITRHPLLWSLGLWSLVHMANNADPAGLSLFGYLFLLALLGTLPIDRRRAKLIERTHWVELRAQTSNIPFIAIFKGRQKLWPALKEIGWLVPLCALAGWAFMLTFHERFYGLPVFY